jgi:hypothetical protein
MWLKDKAGMWGLEPQTSTVSRSRLTVTDWNSTALAATFGVARKSQELLMDPDWTQIENLDTSALLSF